MGIKELVEQAGTVRVNLAPLLLIVGAAMTTGDISIESAVDLLDPAKEV